MTGGQLRFMPMPEHFNWNPSATGDLAASGTIEIAASVVNINANTTYWTAALQCIRARSGRIDGKATGGKLNIIISIDVVASAGTPNAKLQIQARNVGAANWVDLLPLTGGFAISVVSINKTYTKTGWLTVAGFNGVPFEIRVGVQSDSAVNLATASVRASSYIEGAFEPGK